MRLLVRHAHAGHKHVWPGPDAERPLSVRGWEQAEGLRKSLAGLPVRRLMTSPSLRCCQTLLPLAASLGLDPQPVDVLGVDGDVEQLVGLLAAPSSAGTVWCTHGEVLGVLLPRLRARGILQPDHRASDDGWLRYEKGSAWLLDGRSSGGFHARYLPPGAPDPELAAHAGGVRAQLGRLAVEQQRLLATVAGLTATTQRLAARLEQQRAAVAAEHAAVASQLDRARQTTRALAGARARLEETQGALFGRLPATTAPPARMVAGLTDAGAFLVSAAGELARRHPDRHWAVLAEQPLAVRAQPGLVERLLSTVLEAANQVLPPASPTWVIARATAAGAVVAIAADPTALPLLPQPGLPPDELPPAARRPPPPAHQASPSPVDQARRLAERLGGALTLPTGAAGAATQLVLRLPLAAPPDEVWPDLPAYLTTAGQHTYGR